MEGMGERTVVVGSLSKEHRMIGWRVGWVAGPADTVTDAGWAHVYNTTMPVAISRFAATAVLRGDQGHVAECVAELEHRRDTMLSGLPGWPLVSRLTAGRPSTSPPRLRAHGGSCGSSSRTPRSQPLP
jgi:aspartate/methionine/tyrosine aminotransferase